MRRGRGNHPRKKFTFRVDVAENTKLTKTALIGVNPRQKKEDRSKEVRGKIQKIGVNPVILSKKSVQICEIRGLNN